MQRYFHLRVIPLLLMWCHSAVAQDLSFHLKGGVLNYQGDLRQEIYTFQGVKLGFGLGATYAITPQLSAGLEFTQGKIAADDRFNSNPGLFYRNLNFTTNITELALMGTFYILNPLKMRLSPYITAGISLFRFNPYTYDQGGQKFYLQPLGTEGQGLPGYNSQPYRLIQLSIPFGGGIAFRLNDRLHLSWEVVIRKTGTDYLDDVSTVYPDPFDLLTGRGPNAVDLSFRGDEIPINPVFPFGFQTGGKRGNPGEKDWYYFSGLKLTLRIPSSDRSSGVIFGKNRTDCPRW
jgi:Domain of unknown function (DUF6089)